MTKTSDSAVKSAFVLMFDSLLCCSTFIVTATFIKFVDKTTRGEQRFRFEVKKQSILNLEDL